MSEEDRELSIIDAMNLLSSMSEVDMNEEDQKEYEGEINWNDPKQALKNIGLVGETFRVIHRYLQTILRKEEASLKDPLTQKGIKSIMLLVGEAVKKMDQFAALYPGQYQPISHLKEYKELSKYYEEFILRQAPEIEMLERQGTEFKEFFEKIEIEKDKIKDLEAVRKDQNYELFFIKNENHKPYFSPSLLRHIRLMGNFDELVSSVEGEDDPFLKIRQLYDEELHAGAVETHKQAATYIDAFYKEAMRHRDNPLVALLNKALMGLRMAANSKNLIENESYKSCLEYYTDFQRFLREALQTEQYKHILALEDGDELSHTLIQLTHVLCGLFFSRNEPKRDALQLIHHLIQRGGKSSRTWEERDSNIREFLKQYPNGPLLKTFDIFQEEEYEGFDPLAQQNFPCEQYAFGLGSIHITALRIPCPTKQVQIHEADVDPEFEGFLRYYKNQMAKDKHLLINLQDRTSWQEFSRSIALENLSKEAEFNETLFIVGLAKDTDFYNQINEYEQVTGAPVFLEQLEEQLNSKENCGWYFPELDKELKSFIKEAIQIVHLHFFDEKEQLSQEERQDFIEIFYLFLILKMVEKTRVDSLSFTCKDAIDTGAIQSALFYAAVSLLMDSQPDKEQLLWLIYAPALLIRERAVDEARLKRGMRALDLFHERLKGDRKTIIKAINRLFDELKF